MGALKKAMEIIITLVPANESKDTLKSVKYKIRNIFRSATNNSDSYDEKPMLNQV